LKYSPLFRVQHLVNNALLSGNKIVG
jgi:hypothetical protein